MVYEAKRKLMVSACGMEPQVRQSHRSLYHHMAGPQEEGMPQHGTPEAPLYSLPHLTSIKHIPLNLFINTLAIETVRDQQILIYFFPAPWIDKKLSQ